ncbi:DUF3054 domain-containing protein [Microbacterium sp. CR_7]|uniref:DUF3054 domain-containing protein n=1 Tax=Microbacterium sp. CR_7 TaxID=3055792 RepID=UPI0035BF9424
MRFVPAFILDAVFVLVFAVIGRASHQEDAAGFLVTAWPFLVALLLGHLVAALLPGRPRRPWSLAWGAVVWVVTVVGGMLLRVVSGDTAQVAFIIVATLVLGVLLVGWRAVAALLRRRSSARAASAPAGDGGALDGVSGHAGAAALDDTGASEPAAPDEGTVEHDRDPRRD